MTKKKITLLAIFAISLVALATYWMKKNEVKTIEVETSKIDLHTIEEKVSATGKIQPELEVKISSEVSGEIIGLYVTEGQYVNKGDLLVKINPDLYQSSINRSVAGLSTSKANLQQAEAQLKEAKLQYERNKTLLDKGVISKAEWDKIAASYEVAMASRNSAIHNVQAAQATVTEAKDNMNRTTIYAPMSGTISRLNVETGERVLGTQQMTGTELMRIANLENMEVEVEVNENDIIKIKVGNQAVIEVDAYPKKEFKGIVTSISNSAQADLSLDQVTNFKVKIKILKDSYADILENSINNISPFRPGMTATVDIISQQKEKVIAVPISAILLKTDTDASKNATSTANNNNQKKKEAVFVKNGEEVVLRFVKTGIQDNQYIEITDGLKKGDEVITGPYELISKDLKVGDKVIQKKK